MESFELRARVNAPVDRVWEVFTDHRGWQDWAGVKEVVLRQQGDPPPNGVGATRVIRRSGIAIEEEVTAFEPPKRMTYRMTAGIPVRDYVGEVEFTPDADGTEIRWCVRFRPSIPLTGGLLSRALQRGLQDILDRLCRLDFGKQ